MTAAEISHGTPKDDHIGVLLMYVIHRWPSPRSEVIKEVQPYWSSRDEVAVIDWIAMKDRRIIIPASLQKRAPVQLHINHMGYREDKAIGLFIYLLAES